MPFKSMGINKLRKNLVPDHGLGEVVTVVSQAAEGQRGRLLDARHLEARHDDGIVRNSFRKRHAITELLETCSRRKSN